MKKLTVFLCAMVFLFGVMGTANSAPMLWAVTDGGNDHWYEQINNNTTWLTANEIANSMTYNGFQGHLATIVSEEENTFISTYIVDAANSLRVGGYQINSDDEPGGNWAWVTGETWNYSNWELGEPNNVEGVENYLEIREKIMNNCIWNDIPGDDPRHSTGFIVEYETPPVPIPSAIWLLGSAFIGLVGFRKKLRKEA